MSIVKRGLSSRSEKWIIFAGSFLFFAFLAWCSPLSFDDFEFASLKLNSGADLWTFVSQYGNGRFLGNVFSIAMAQLPWLSVLGRAFILASLVILLPDALGQQSCTAYCLSFLLIVTMDSEMFGQVITWISGFCNYIPPVWLTLVILCAFRRETQTKSGAAVQCCLVFLLGLCSQLFVEHSSGVNFLFALCITFVSFRKQSQSRYSCTCWLLGTAIGLAIMLVGPGFFPIPGNHTDHYRSISLGDFHTLAETCIRNALSIAFFYLTSSSLVLCVGCGAAIHLAEKNLSARRKKCLRFSWALCFGYLLFTLTHSLDDYMGKAALIQHCGDLCVLAALLITWVLAARHIGPDALRGKVLFCLIFGTLSLLPLLVVNPVFSRVVFHAYLFYGVAGLLCLGQILTSLKPPQAATIKKAGIALALSASLVLSVVFASVRHMDSLRRNHILSQIDARAETIEIFLIPYDYVWDYTWGYAIFYEDIAGYSPQFTAIPMWDWLDVYS